MAFSGQQLQYLKAMGIDAWSRRDTAILDKSDPVSRAAFVKNLKAFVDEYDLDGSDIDWEYPVAQLTLSEKDAQLPSFKSLYP